MAIGAQDPWQAALAQVAADFAVVAAHRYLPADHLHALVHQQQQPQAALRLVPRYALLLVVALGQDKL